MRRYIYHLPGPYREGALVDVLIGCYWACKRVYKRVYERV